MMGREDPPRNGTCQKPGTASRPENPLLVAKLNGNGGRVTMGKNRASNHVRHYSLGSNISMTSAGAGIDDDDLSALFNSSARSNLSFRTDPGPGGTASTGVVNPNPKQARRGRRVAGGGSSPPPLWTDGNGANDSLGSGIPRPPPPPPPQSSSSQGPPPLPVSPLEQRRRQNIPPRGGGEGACRRMQFRQRSMSAPNLKDPAGGKSRGGMPVPSSPNMYVIQPFSSAHLDADTASRLVGETIAIPARRRSVSTHSDGRDGIQGLLEDLAKLDAEEADKERRRAERAERKRRKRAAAAAAAAARAAMAAASETPVPPEPQRVELTPKESLVERERQARVETERARLKRQLALTRELEDGMDGDGGVDATDGDAAALTRDESVAGTVGDASSEGGAPPPPSPQPPLPLPDDVGEGGKLQLGYVMERFLSDGVVGGGGAAGAVSGDTLHVTNDAEADDVASRTRAVMEAIRASPSLAPAGVVMVNTSDPRSGNLTGTMVLPDGSSASSSLLSDLLAREEDLEEMVALNSGLSPPGSVSGAELGEAATLPAGVGVEGAESAAGVACIREIVMDPEADEKMASASFELDSDDESGVHRLAGSFPSYSSASGARMGVAGLNPMAVQKVASTSVAADSVETNSVDDLEVSLPSYSSGSQQGEVGGGIVGLDEVDSAVAAMGLSGAGSGLERRGNDHGGSGSARELSIERQSVRTHPSMSDAPPRLLRLTEAEIIEMNAIDYASIGNAPPHSLRSEHLASFSESSMGGGAGRGLNAFSEETCTTVQESVSVTSAGGQSVGAGQLSHRMTDNEPEEVLTDAASQGEGIISASATSPLLMSPGIASNASVAVMPSECGRERHHTSSPIGDGIPSDDSAGVAYLKTSDSGSQEHEEEAPRKSRGMSGDNSDRPPLSAQSSLASLDSSISDGVVNRTIRPGMVNTLGAMGRGRPRNQGIHKRAVLMPPKPLVVDDFDYDKYDDSHPLPPHAGILRPSNRLRDVASPARGITASSLTHNGAHVSQRKLPGDSPDEIFFNSIRGADSEEFRSELTPFADSDTGFFPSLRDEELGMSANGVNGYGATLSRSNDGMMREASTDLMNFNGPDKVGTKTSETQPLVGVPREVNMGAHGVGHHSSIASIIDSVFSSVRSASTDDIEADMDDSDKYLNSGMIARAFPERFLALAVTLAVEIPVLLTIAGGSDRLCMLIGRRRYQLIMAFLPLSSAISGNCGLQGSTLTARAVSHLHVTKASYGRWLWTEVGASFFLGLSMGAVLGLLAYEASSNDPAFGFTIFFAQFLSILAAGLTGTLAPIIFTFIFHRESGKWGGLLETAIQDVVGTFAMVVLSFRFLLLFGPTEIDPNDTCGG